MPKGKAADSIVRSHTPILSYQDHRALGSSLEGPIRSNARKLGNQKQEGLQTLIEFDLPFALPIPDGDYSLTLHGKSAVASVKRVQHKQSEGWVTTGTVDLMFDRRGRFAHSHILLALSWAVDLNEKGRKPKLLDTSRSKAKE